MAGSKEGGLKAAATVKARRGKDYYKRIGHLGGSKPTDKPKGFAAMPKAKVRAAGRRGGKLGRIGGMDPQLYAELKEQLEQEPGLDWNSMTEEEVAAEL